MNYLRIYLALCQKAADERGRVEYLPKGNKRPGFEHHHIVPKGFRAPGKADETNEANNCCYLTDREHYVAHRLLARLHQQQAGALRATAMTEAFAHMSVTARNSRAFVVARQLGSEKAAEAQQRLQARRAELKAAGYSAQTIKDLTRSYAVPAEVRQAAWKVTAAFVERFVYYTGSSKSKGTIKGRAADLEAMGLDVAKVRAVVEGKATRYSGYTWTARTFQGWEDDSPWYVASSRARAADLRVWCALHGQDLDAMRPLLLAEEEARIENLKTLLRAAVKEAVQGWAEEVGR